MIVSFLFLLESGLFVFLCFVIFAASQLLHLSRSLATQVLHLSRLEIHSLSWIIIMLLLTLKLCQPCYYKERCYCLNIWSSLIGHDTCMRYGLTAAQNRVPGVLTEWKVLLIPQEGKTDCPGSQSLIIRQSVAFPIACLYLLYLVLLKETYTQQMSCEKLTAMVAYKIILWRYNE